ncbi:MAG: RluA family pseudouridine synthase, partial [Candidatus Glassbacteria bacterium]|nr:RluA family pseudouridine synthase [Candidatus Glassbacteria bacterium]
NGTPRSTQQIEVSGKESGLRLDVFLARRMGVSRSRAATHCRKGLVLKADSGRPAKPSTVVASGEKYSFTPFEDSPRGSEARIESIPLDIVFEDESLLVVDKPAGMVVHPAPGHYSGTLVNALLGHLGRELDPHFDRLRPGIVHRLDKDTSGLLVVAKTFTAHQRLSEQIKTRRADRTYLCLSWGHWSLREDTISEPIDRCSRNRKKMAVSPVSGRLAATSYRVRESYDLAELVEVKLHTGRTHQIRVHFSFRGHPVLGDPLYGGRANALRALGSSGERKSRIKALLAACPRQALHAAGLSFDHPVTGKRVGFSSSLPSDIEDALRILRLP